MFQGTQPGARSFGKEKLLPECLSPAPPQNPRIELLPIHEELLTLGVSSAKQHAQGSVEEYSVLWHLMKRLGLDVTGKDSGSPPFQVSGGGIEALG
ncbi:MAG: hypothetical protein EBS01_09360 [Verrucomicrobia bacterium]|nr:hypothetical protein [Verrucomicrobiota bacterium]